MLPRLSGEDPIKFFDQDSFLNDMSNVNWLDVYLSQDLDLAVSIFEEKFKEVLDRHAKWVIFLKRKHFTPWITEDTLNLIKLRDLSKKEAVQIVREGGDAAVAWSNFKKLRNKVNNRTKYEERQFKSSQITDNLNSMSKVWTVAKQDMQWKRYAWL